MRLGWCFNISQGKNIIIDAFRVYLHGASISHRVRISLYVRLGCIRLVLQYLTGKEDHYRYVKGVFALCFNISQGKVMIDAFRVYLHGASIPYREKKSLYMRLESIRMVLQYLTGCEDHYRFVFIKGVLG